jgi:hypothetical protein
MVFKLINKRYMIWSLTAHVQDSTTTFIKQRFIRSILIGYTSFVPNSPIHSENDRNVL